MRPLRLFQTCCLLFVCMIPVYRAEEVPPVNSPSRPWPYMAFVYYTDDKIRDASGSRFIRGAVLLTSEHLLVSSLDHPNATVGSFPEKTLVARSGAITVDDHFTLNEEENEQEREVIKVYRASNDSDAWWSNDLQLVRVVKTFEITPAVNISSHMPPMHDFTSGLTQCSLLFYNKRFQNDSDDRILTEANMEVLPMGQCSNHNHNNFSICLGPPKSTMENENYCLGNSGGPVMCSDRLTSMYSVYVSSCNSPRLFQTLDAQAKFIDCAVTDNCNNTECSEYCVAQSKDPIEPPILRGDNKMVDESEDTDVEATAVSTNDTAPHKQTRTVALSNETSVLDFSNKKESKETAPASNNATGTENKVRITSKKVHLRSNTAICSSRIHPGIVYFIVSSLIFGVYSNDFNA